MRRHLCVYADKQQSLDRSFAARANCIICWLTHFNSGAYQMENEIYIFISFKMFWVCVCAVGYPQIWRSVSNSFGVDRTGGEARVDRWFFLLLEYYSPSSLCIYIRHSIARNTLAHTHTRVRTYIGRARSRSNVRIVPCSENCILFVIASSFRLTIELEIFSIQQSGGGDDVDTRRYNLIEWVWKMPKNANKKLYTKKIAAATLERSVARSWAGRRSSVVATLPMYTLYERP